jgi:organic hydroperoxide reductase OsmC/OhrA
MHPFPHRYVASAQGAPSGTVAVDSPSLPSLVTAPPPEFDGPGGIWSPETLFVGAIADCFILTFRGLARAAGLEWTDLACRVEGVLDRVERVSQFTHYATHATLRIPASADEAKASELLHKAEDRCLISNSLKGTRELVAEVVRS